MGLQKFLYIKAGNDAILYHPFPATMTLSARWAPHNTSAARIPGTRKRSSSSENSARSAWVPARGFRYRFWFPGIVQIFCRPAESVKMVNRLRPVVEPLQVHGLSDFLNEIEQSCEAEPSTARPTGRQLLPRRGHDTATRKQMIGTGAVRNTRTGAKPCDLVVIKMNAMRKPGPVRASPVAPNSLPGDTRTSPGRTHLVLRFG